ncbi:uncharacterized protein BDZ99DRAFT_149369 [Mytilinidion resinicola]|uniref:Uncharacterized protein n=1 Tax=Mytilinidion resinicola TaxID=574789 RepID=A0A6A6Y9X5_9PEZI|nr:uncharacterized protein BDZ99DRAFT_149369 [Mytilinidion resinicola]KAF2804627.1 hypothetical protein BDZ99DRAFT_149369 [Mytilinidion resinicola]
MDQKNKARLKHLSKTTIPRYLFRGWCALSGGGAAGLNTVDGVCPHAFNRGRGHKNVYNLTYDQLHTMAVSHYGGGLLPETELSSWAASISVALSYARREPSSHLAILDTKVLGSSVKVWHAPQLLDWGPHEYLAHGPIGGDGYKAVPVTALEAAGLRALGEDPKEYEYLLRDEQAGRHSPPAKLEVSGPDVIFGACKQVAELYGRAFAMPVALALLAWVPRDWYCYDEPSAEDKAVITRGLTPLATPQDWTESVAILVDDRVDTGGYLDVRRLMKLMQVLADRNHGKGVRQREMRERKRALGEAERNREQVENLREGAHNQKPNLEGKGGKGVKHEGERGSGRTRAGNGSLRGQRRVEKGDEKKDEESNVANGGCNGVSKPSGEGKKDEAKRNANPEPKAKAKNNALKEIDRNAARKKDPETPKKAKNDKQARDKQARDKTVGDEAPKLPPGKATKSAQKPKNARRKR